MVLADGSWMEWGVLWLRARGTAAVLVIVSAVVVNLYVV